MKFLTKKQIVSRTDLIDVRDAGFLGRGVFAKKNISKGKFLGVYNGEKIDSKQCDDRVSRGKGHYIFEFENGIFFDGKIGGDWTSMINHNRNCNVEAISDTPSQTIKLYTVKCVRKTEQLFLNYGKNWFKDNNIEEL